MMHPSKTFDPAALLPVALAAAREAGAILRDEGARLREVTFSDRSDVKLAADTAAERSIRAALTAATPEIPIYGEELGGDADLVAAGALLWIVDPLDGTFNYLRELPLCAVSIGLMRGTEPLLGVIYDFNQDRLYTGCGDRFEINGEAATPSWAPERAQAALVTGLPAGLDKDPATLAAFAALLSPYKKVRMVGTAALALAFVASGRADVYFEPSIRLWDVAAGLALVKAAGGTLRVEPSANGKTLAYDVWAAGRAEFIHR